MKRGAWEGPGCPCPGRLRDSASLRDQPWETLFSWDSFKREGETEVIGAGPWAKAEGRAQIANGREQVWPRLPGPNWARGALAETRLEYHQVKRAQGQQNGDHSPEVPFVQRGVKLR